METVRNVNKKQSYGHKYTISVTSLEAVCLLVYFYLRREKLQYILDKADSAFKYKSETNMDQIDMSVGIIQGKILVKWCSLTYLVVILFVGLWPLLSMSSER